MRDVIRDVCDLCKGVKYDSELRTCVLGGYKQACEERAIRPCSLSQNV